MGNGTLIIINMLMLGNLILKQLSKRYCMSFNFLPLLAPLSFSLSPFITSALIPAFLIERELYLKEDQCNYEILSVPLCSVVP